MRQALVRAPLQGQAPRSARWITALVLFCLALSFFISQAPATRAAPLGQTIWLRAVSSGKYVSADQNRGATAPLVADRASASGWEQFQIVDAGGGYVALRSVGTTKYVSADQNLANVPLVANRTAIGGWEQFQWIDNAAGQVQLRSIGNSRYVSADMNLGAWAPLVANRTAPSGWETFYWGTVGSTPQPTTGPQPTSPPSTGWPAKVVAPYVETWSNLSLTNAANSTGNKYFTLAFVISNGSCTATWNGNTAMSANLYGSQISSLRSMGGDVAISFGGAAGTELGQACTSVSSLQAAYQSVINQYRLRWLDFDIESGAECDTASVTRRNQVIRNLQAANPGIRVSYTLPVATSGLTSCGLNMLRNAQTNGARVDIVNIMAMDYGPCIDMGQAAIDASNATHNQLNSIGMGAKIGITPMTGINDVTCENFTTGNATTVTNFANANSSWIAEIAYWALGRDSGYTYLNIFKNFR